MKMPKMHIGHLLIATGIYLAAFSGMFISSMVIGIIAFDSSYRDEEMIYILSLVFMVLVSLASYLIYFFRQRKIAEEHINAEYLGLGERILGGSIASIITAVVFFCCLFWTTERNGEIETPSLLTNLYITGVFLGLLVVINFVNFIVFKPRP